MARRNGGMNHRAADASRTAPCVARDLAHQPSIDHGARRQRNSKAEAGALLVIDDLCATPPITEGELAAIEMFWANGSLAWMRN